MARILMAWELGGGLGHVKPLLRVAKLLESLGHQPIFALRNVSEPAVLFEGRTFPVLQAPFFQGRTRPEKFLASSFADILAIRGYANDSDLLSMVQAWQSLLDLVKPKVIVADFAPTLCLAAYGELPVVNIGNGFSNPPCDQSQFPTLVPTAKEVIPQDRLLAVVQSVQKERHRKVPGVLTEFLRDSHSFVRTWPELDPYRSSRKEDACGSLLLYPPPVPFPNEQRFFAYLSEANQAVVQSLQGLLQAGLSGKIYVRRGADTLRHSISTPKLQVLDRPAPIVEALGECSFVIHHASLGTAEAALVAGRPQLVLPRHLEQQLTAQALESLGVGKHISGRVSMSEIINTAKEMHTAEFRQRTTEVANEFFERQSEDVLNEIVTSIEEQIEAD